MPQAKQERIYNALLTVPKDDVNFKSALEDTDIETVQKVLKNLPDFFTKSKRKILEAKLKSLEKVRPKQIRDDLLKRKNALEKKGWEFEIEWKSGVKIFGNEKQVVEGAVSLDALFNEAEAIENSFQTPTSPTENQPENNPDQIVLIPVGKIVESPFEPQERRRQKFKTKSGTEAIVLLGDSITLNGLQQPILVRPVGDFFEIVFGERRFLAHLLKGIKTIPCFVKNLSDAKVIELQYEENHNRLEPDPLDDAFTFAYLKKEKNYSVHDLAIKFSTSETSILRKLKLNDLIESAKKLLSDGILPLGHAVFMAALGGDAQTEIVENDFLFLYGDRDQRILTLEEFKYLVGEEIIRDLTNAPFDVTDPRLHINNLICGNCTERTGYEPKLFDEGFVKNDKCLNKKCFEVKSNVHLKLTQQEIAEEMTASGASTGTDEETFKETLKSVPLVTEKSVVNKKELPVKGNVLTGQELHDEPECEFSVKSVAIDGVKKGRKVYVCQNGKCPVHHPVEVNNQGDKLSDYDLQLNEKQFQIDVALVVREKVLEKSIEFFNGSNSFWQYADLIEKLIAEFISERAFHLKELSEIFKDFKNFPKNLLDKKSVEAFVRELDPRRKDQLLFLLVFSKEGYMSATGEYKSQAEIEKLAKSYAKLDYDRLDADVRVELAPDEFKETARNYRNEIFNDWKPEVPRFWWMEFTFPD